jgi:hypothetical protein
VRVLIEWRLQCRLLVLRQTGLPHLAIVFDETVRQYVYFGGGDLIKKGVEFSYALELVSSLTGDEHT